MSDFSYQPVALILAAGSGSRIGQPKLKLEYFGKPLIEYILDVIEQTNVRRCVVVAREQHREWLNAQYPEVEVMINSSESEAMFSSVRCGVASLSGASGALVIPVDLPFVSLKTYHQVLDAHRERENCWITPRFNNQNGHPIIIPQNLFYTIRCASNDDRLDYILLRLNIPRVIVDVADPEIIRNINSMNDLPEGVKNEQR